MKHVLPAVFAVLLLAPLAVFAQQSTLPLPEMPAPIQELSDQGAQVRYLGRDHGMDAWITIKNGQEQYFYVLPDGSGFVMGLLFDNKGKLITTQQVKRLQQSGDTLLETLASDVSPRNSPLQATPEFKSPSERLFYEIQNSNWVPLGKGGAPVAYAFIDPQCPHCHEFVSDLRKGKYLDDGRIQLRLVPVGFRDETRAQAAFLIATPDPQKKWFAHMDGDVSALPAKSDISDQGVQRNLAIMQSWEFSVTPMIIYRGQDGTVKLVRGRPKDMEGFLNDLGTSPG